MSRIIITGSNPITSSTLGYMRIDNQAEMKLKYNKQPISVSLSPGKHRLFLTKLSPFNRSSSSGVLDMATDYIQSKSGDSWEGIVTLSENDVLFVHIATKLGNQFSFFLIDESEVNSYINKYADKGTNTGKIIRIGATVALVIFGVSALFNMTSNKSSDRADEKKPRHIVSESSMIEERESEEVEKAEENTIKTEYYTLTVPESWAGRFVVEKSVKNGFECATVYHKKEREENGLGLFFSIYFVSDPNYFEYLDGMLFAKIDIGETYYLYASLPNGVDYSDENAEEYLMMYNSIGSVLDTISSDKYSVSSYKPNN